jgi:type VI secretion system secreted protein VgrG
MNAQSSSLTDGEVEHVELSIGGAPLEVLSLKGDEGLSRLFSFQIVCSVGAGDAAPAALIAQEAVITLRDGYRGERRITGLVSAASWEVFDNQRAELHATIRPKVWPIGLGRDCYVLQDVDVIDVARDVLADAHMPVRYEITGSYAKRAYCAQYREDDWTFLTRLFEEEGVFYWFDHEGGETTLVIGDSSSSAPEITGGAFIPFAYETGMRSGTELVEEIGSAVKATSTKFTVGSFDPMHPNFKVSAEEGQGPFEHYDAPGGGPESPAVVSARARTKRQAAAAARESVGGLTSSARLVPGMYFELGGHPMARLDGQYLITGTSYEIEQRGRNSQRGKRPYACRFTAIQLKTPFRPPHETPRAKQTGLQLGMVVGPPGQEIHPAPDGRIRVQHYWDRLGKRDHTAGKWVRVAQRSTQGSMLLPRVGWNVATFNEEGAIDAPSMLSRIHDAEHPPAYELPANMTRVVWKTATSPGGGTFNEVYFEDKRGAEEMFINASKDMNVHIQNLKNESVLRDSKRTVVGNHSMDVAQEWCELVVRDQTVYIAGDETINISAGRGKAIGGDETITIGGTRKLTTGQDHSTSVEKKRKLDVGSTLTEKTPGHVSSLSTDASVDIGGTLSRTTSDAAISEDVGTICTRETTGNKIEIAKRSWTLEVQKNYVETINGSVTLATEGRYLDTSEKTSSWDVTAALTAAAPEIWIEAIKEIRIKCGASMITILPESIAFTSTEIDLSGATLWAKTGQIHHN